MPSSVPVGGMRMSVTTTSGTSSPTSDRSSSKEPHEPTTSRSATEPSNRTTPSRNKTLSSANTTRIPTDCILGTAASKAGGIDGSATSGRRHRAAGDDLADEHRGVDVDTGALDPRLDRSEERRVGKEESG